MIRKQKLLHTPLITFLLLTIILVLNSFQAVSAQGTVEPVTFAVIGDYGDGTPSEKAVADLVKSWNPAFIVTTGDNNYPSGDSGTIDKNIGQFYSEYIYPYSGTYTSTPGANRFFPSLGNHDLLTEAGKPYYDYFSLPGNERYYDISLPPVHLYILNSNETEPDGFRVDSVQAQWLKTQLALEKSSWKIVVLHLAPYSSGMHGPTAYMQWPFKEWGADLVLSGHDHTYERLSFNGLTYVVNGVGGQSRYNFIDILPQSLIRYNAASGAMRVTATSSTLLTQFINQKGELIDFFILFNNKSPKVFIPAVSMTRW